VRARHPDVTGTVERDGVTLGYEIFGDGAVTVLLLPTWTIIHSRFWKFQAPYLARRHRVITYDGPGNGHSDRVTDPSRYSADAYAADAEAVLDACNVDRAIVVGVSLGAQYGTRLAIRQPDRVAGLVLIGPALPLVPPAPERASLGAQFDKPYPENPRDWEKYNLAYWHDHYDDFAQFFFDQLFSEPHSTKPIEDSVSWAAETSPEVLAAEASRPRGVDGTNSSVLTPEHAIRHWSDMLQALTCPVLVVHGTHDRIQPYESGVEAARITSGTLATFEGSGHMPNVRDPVRFNLVLRDFIERVGA
jgi:pimeloyl-ACP methyl ester carboxylesterase